MISDVVTEQLPHSLPVAVRPLGCILTSQNLEKLPYLSTGDSVVRAVNQSGYSLCKSEWLFLVPGLP